MNRATPVEVVITSMKTTHVTANPSTTATKTDSVSSMEGNAYKSVGFKRRERTPWTIKEIMSLKLGVAMYGVGMWSKIIKNPHLSFHPSRCTIDIKDKNMVRANYSVSLNDLNFFRVGVRIMGISRVSLKDDTPLFSLITNLMPTAIHLMPAQPQHPDWYRAVSGYINLLGDSKILSKDIRLWLLQFLENEHPLSQTLVFSHESLAILCQQERPIQMKQ